MDHIRYGTNTRWFVMPSKLPDDEVIEMMEDGLLEIVPLKLEQILLRQDELVAERSLRLKVLHDSSVDSFTAYFWSLLTEIEYSEYDVLSKWLRYWLHVYEKATRNAGEWTKISQEIEKQGLTQDQIETAKAFPIEELYQGKLRMSGGRYTGKCPFHKEKTASFHIFEDHFHCFGCQAHGDAIDFYMKSHDVGFTEAVRALSIL